MPGAIAGDLALNLTVPSQAIGLPDFQHGGADVASYVVAPAIQPSLPEGHHATRPVLSLAQRRCRAWAHATMLLVAVDLAHSFTPKVVRPAWRVNSAIFVA